MPFSIGSTDITKVSLGDTEIKAVSIGDVEIYSSGPPPELKKFFNTTNIGGRNNAPLEYTDNSLETVSWGQISGTSVLYPNFHNLPSYLVISDTNVNSSYSMELSFEIEFLDRYNYVGKGNTSEDAPSIQESFLFGWSSILGTDISENLPHQVVDGGVGVSDNPFIVTKTFVIGPTPSRISVYNLFFQAPYFNFGRRLSNNNHIIKINESENSFIRVFETP